MNIDIVNPGDRKIITAVISGDYTFEKASKIKWKLKVYSKNEVGEKGFAKKLFSISDDGLSYKDKTMFIMPEFKNGDVGKCFKFYAYVEGFIQIPQMHIFYVEEKHQTNIRIKGVEQFTKKPDDKIFVIGNKDVGAGDTVRCEVKYSIDDKKVPDQTKKNVKWMVKVGNEKESRLLIEGKPILGGEIEFKIPGAWADKNILLMPFLAKHSKSIFAELNTNNHVVHKLKITKIKDKSEIAQNIEIDGDKLEIEYGERYKIQVLEIKGTKTNDVIRISDKQKFEWRFSYEHYENGIIQSNTILAPAFELKLEKAYMQNDTITLNIIPENLHEEYTVSITVKFKFEFNRSTLVSEVKDRKTNPWEIRQPGPLCGIAAPCYIWAKYKKDEYAETVLELHAKGVVTINDYTIKPDDHLFKIATSKKPSGRASADWILMASIRDTENIFFDYGDRENESYAGITTANKVMMLLKKMCKFSIADEETWGGYTNKIPIIRWTEKGVKERIDKIDTYYKNGKEILLMIDSDLVADDYSIEPDYHWVVYEGNLKKTDDRAFFNVYSWGSLTYKVDSSYARIRRNWYQYIVVTV